MSNFPDPKFPDQKPQKSWWGRNWIWVLPLGCLAPILLCCGGGLGIGLFVVGTIKSSDAYKEAVARVTADAEVKKEIGDPVTASYWVFGAIQVDAAGGGHADLIFPISGPKGSAMVTASAEKANGQWNFKTFEVKIDGGGKLIELVPKVNQPTNRAKSKASP